MKIYLASSWRNPYQPKVLDALRAVGHDVYDFRNPAPGNTGFAWQQVGLYDDAKQNPAALRKALEHPVAVDGFNHDMSALRWCDACVCLLPCGNSAHLELGYAAGAGKRTIVYAPELKEPELMYLMTGGLALTLKELLTWLGPATAPAGRPPPLPGTHNTPEGVECTRLSRGPCVLCNQRSIP